MPDWKRYIRAHLPREGFRGEAEGEILEELAAHLEDAYREARARGATAPEAERLAVAEIGDWDELATRILRTREGAGTSRAFRAIEKSEARLRSRGGGWITLADAVREVRFTVRSLKKVPGFSAVVLLTLAIGIGANTAIFAVVKDVLLDPLPFEDADQLVGIWNAAPGMGEDQLPQSLAFNAVYEDDARVFQDVGVWTMSRASVLGAEGPEELLDMLVTQGVFPALRVQPVLGRGFTFEDTQTTSPFTVILSHRYWEERYDADPGVLGLTLTVGGTPREIIGVMPPNFRFMDRDPAFYRPLRYDKTSLTVSNFTFNSIGRLVDGITPEEALPDLARLVPLGPERYPGGMTVEILQQVDGQPVLHSLRDDLVGNVGRILWVVLGGVAIILLVAAANVANLLLVRAEARERSTAVKAALGSPRGRLAGQFLAESLVLAVVGGVLGIGLAHLGLGLLKSLGPGDLPRLHEVGLDAGVVAFALGISLLTGVVLGLLPLARLWRINLVGALKEGGRGFTGVSARNKTRNALVVSQLALALVLLVGSGLMIRSFLSLSRVNPGFSHPEEVLTFRLSLGSREVPDPEDAPGAHERMARRLAEIPGVTSVGLSSSIAMDRRGGFDPIFFEDFPLPDGQSPRIRRFKWVGGGYAETMGNPILAGRSITWDDIHSRARVVMITENMAREVWGEPARAVGRRLATGMEPGDWREIIGVVGDVRDDGIEQGAVDIVYWPMVIEGFWDNPLFVMREMGYAVRSPRVGTPDFLAEVREAVWGSYPSRPLGAVIALAELQRDSMARTSFTLVMLGIAAAVALLLGSIGIYGVISYTVGQRNQELGLRIAMGAEAGTVVGMVLRQGIALALVGAAVGIGAAIGVTRLMTALLHGVNPVDPLTYFVVALTLVVVALLASWLPARRAARMDPMVALRAE
ncbi:MAG: ADOP family duplicated permease [Longimicrobiales bacterium]